MSATPWAERLGPLATEPAGSDLVLHVARRYGERRRGLAKMEPMPPDHGLHIVRTNSVHTFGMRFALDLVWLGRGDRVVRIDTNVPARRVRTCLRARSVIEARAGQGDRFAAAIPGYTGSR
ncbi:MAG: uncharacterized protein V7607_6352 [Solirubrobacteraceae bacterium]